MSTSTPSNTNTNLFNELPYSPSTEDDRFETFERWLLNNSSEAQPFSASPASLQQSKENKFQMFDRWMREKGLLESHRVGTTSDNLSPRDDSSTIFVNDRTRVGSDFPLLPLESDASTLSPTTSLVSPQPSAPPFTAIESSGIQDTSPSSSSSRGQEVDSTVSNDIVAKERFAIYDDKQQLPVTSQGDNVIISIGSNPSSVVSAQPPLTIVEATVVDEVVCDAIPFPVDQNDRLPHPPHDTTSHRLGWCNRHLRYVLLVVLVLIAIGAVAATIVITVTNSAKNGSETNRTDTTETLATDDNQGVPNAPSSHEQSTSAPTAPSSSKKCTFCEGYTINSHLIIPGTVLTCSEVNELAPMFLTGSDECLNVQVAERVCCI